METITIQCWIYRDDVESIFPLQISRAETVGALKNVIKDKTFVRFRDVEADELRLYTIHIHDEHLKDKLEQLSLEDKSCLNSRTKVSELFTESDEEWLMIVNGPDSGAAKSSTIVPTSMTFNCWIRGQDSDAQRIFQVQICGAETVDALRAVIKENNPAYFRHVDSPLYLYKVSFPLDNIGETLEDFNPDDGEFLPPLERVSDIPAEPERLHIIVDVGRGRDATQSVEQEDILAWMVNSFKRTINLITSQEAKSKECMKFQSTDMKILDCRYSADAENQFDTVAPPIHLFNPAFAYFSSKAFDPEYSVPPDYIRDIWELVAQSALIHSNGNARRLHLKSFLQTAIRRPVSYVQDSDGTTPGFLAMSRCGELPVCLIVGEVKNEMVNGGSDPSVQAALSFLRTIRQTENTKLHLRCCRPQAAFLIGHAGPWLTIMGGLITTNCVVQRLTDFLWIPVHSCLDDDQFFRIARVLYALRESVERLDSWYETIEDIPCNPMPVPHPRFFPSPNTFRDKTGIVKFIYQTSLERSTSCTAYLAKTLGSETRNIVVKFVTSYGEDAHRYMATAGFAPELIYYGPINVIEDLPSYGALRMVVMEFVEGLAFDIALKQGKVPRAFKADLQQALEHLHSAGFVFGDLCPPNVIVTLERTSTAQLIDFDWAGKEGEVKYPISISTSIDWPGGVRALEDIRKAHDLAMLRSLTSQCL